MASTNSPALAESAQKSALSTPPILCMGAPRTGTASLGEALRILGYERVHHGTNMVPTDPDYEILDRAADATFETLPTYTGKPFTRTDWDEIIQKWDVVTDMFSYYARSLIPAYPDAKVILVERNIDSWLQSWKDQKKVWFSAGAQLFLKVIGYMTGMMAGKVARKFVTGWIGSNRRQDIFDKAGEAYIRHNKFVRESVPAERLLDFNLKDSWEPLCRFLGKDVPDVPFPRLNDLQSYQNSANEHKRSGAMTILKRVVGINHPAETSNHTAAR